MFGNTNAPPAVTHSAIIYALRCMVTRDIPLNHGCMAPITVRIPEGEGGREGEERGLKGWGWGLGRHSKQQQLILI